MNHSEKLQLDPDRTTVGEVVAQNYHAAGVFRKYGLDFCCGGGISLRKACENNGISREQMIDRLEEIPWSDRTEAQNYQAWEPDYLIDHIENRHHRFVREKCVEIGHYARKVAEVHGERHPENIKIRDLFEDLSVDMMRHMEDEEKRVFPMIRSISEDRRSGRPVEENRIEELRLELARMIGDHQGAGDMISRIAEVSNRFQPPQEACTTYRILYRNLEAFEQDLHLHVHLENNILFRKAEQLL